MAYPASECLFRAQEQQRTFPNISAEKCINPRTNRFGEVACMDTASVRHGTGKTLAALHQIEMAGVSLGRWHRDYQPASVCRREPETPLMKDMKLTRTFVGPPPVQNRDTYRGMNAYVPNRPNTRPHPRWASMPHPRWIMDGLPAYML